MTDEPIIGNPADAIPETPPSPESQATGADITSTAAPSSEIPVTVPITVSVLPIEHKERFWEIAKTDLEEAYKWLIAEINKL